MVSAGGLGVGLVMLGPMLNMLLEPGNTLPGLATAKITPPTAPRATIITAIGMPMSSRPSMMAKAMATCATSMARDPQDRYRHR